MKIAFFSDTYLDLPGGIKSSINAQKTALENRGHEVKIFSTAYPCNQESLESLKNQQIYTVPCCKVFLRGLTPVSRNPQKLEIWLLETHPELKNFDIFYIHYEAGLSIAALKLAKKLEIPAVQVMHGREDVGEAGIIPFGFRTIVASALNFAHAQFLPHSSKITKDNYLADTIAKTKMWELMVAEANAADLVLTPSRHFRTKLKSYGVEKTIKIFPNGLADQNFPTHAKLRKFKPNQPLKLIWHSRLSSEKRLLSFLEALAKLNYPYFLDIFGDGPDLILARTFAKSHRLKVKFHGPVSFADLAPFLAEAHLDVLPSYNFDTFGMTLIEAQAFGTPALICDPDLAETIPEGTFLLTKAPTSTAIAETLEYLAMHPELITKMSRKMLKTRHEVLISKRIELLEDYFNDLLTSSRNA